jgi:hypothetical protein
VRREQAGRCVCGHGAALWLWLRLRSWSGVSRGNLDHGNCRLEIGRQIP